MARVHAFLDTNICLHWQRFDQVPWCELLSSDQVDIVFCRPVIRELDEKKYSARYQKLRDRARAALRTIEQLVADPTNCWISDGAAVKYAASVQSLREIASQNGLDLDIPDDAVLACALADHRDRSHDKVVVVTGDVGMRLKARELGLAVFEPPDRFKLRSAASEAERELRRLKKEIVELQKRVPLIELEFENGSRRTTARLAVHKPMTSSQRHQLIATAHAKAPLMNRGEPPEQDPFNYDRVHGLSALQFVGHSDREIERYNADVENYRRAYAHYVARHERHFEWAARTAEINVRIVNSGSAPAEDVDVHVQFNDAIATIWTSKTLPVAPKAPEPPARLDCGFGLGRRLLQRDVLGLSHDAALRAFPDVELIRWEVDESEPRVARLHLPRVKHNQSESLPTLYVTWLAAAALETKLNYRFEVGNHPKRLSGALTIDVEAVPSGIPRDGAST